MRSDGTSLVEMTIALGLIFCVLSVGLPAMSQAADARRTRDAAAFLAGQFRFARHRAVLTGRHVAIVFDDVAGGVGWRVCRDGDRDGVSREDIAAGVDPCDGTLAPVSRWFSDVEVGYAPGVPSPDGETGASPLRFGTTRMAVFSPSGTSSSGTVALRGASGNQCAVRVSGMTGRIRALRFDFGVRRWSE